MAETRARDTADLNATVDALPTFAEAAALTNRNLLYNGAMQVAQRGTSSTGITSSGYYTADRWSTVIGNQGTWTQTVESDAPTGSGFRNSLKMLCTTADAAPAAADTVRIRQVLEGQDVQRVAKGTASAQQLTLSFWVKSNVTGTYIADLIDNDNTRQVSAAYTISASATWEKKTITFPADTTGAFDNDNALSLIATFWLGVGSDRSSGTLNTVWGATVNANIAPGQTNLAAATDNYWQVTGVQLEVGPVATPFEFKSFGQELAECQRYFWRMVNGTNQPMGVGAYYSSAAVFDHVVLPVQMRIAPSLVATEGTDYYQIFRNAATDTFNFFDLSVATSNVVELDHGNTRAGQASGTAGHAGFFRSNNAASSVAFSAEL